MMKEYLDKRDTEYMRNNMVFNYCLGNEERNVIESYIHNNDIHIAFNPEHFYFLMTGVNHRFVRSFNAERFHKGILMTLNTFDAMIESLKESGYIGQAFHIKTDNSKQIAVLFSPTKNTVDSIDKVIQKMMVCLNDGYTPMFLPEIEYISFISTSFVGPYSGYEQIHQAFLDARELNDLLFFGIHNTIITKEYREKNARPCDVTAILGNVRRLITTICTGTQAQALKQADYIIREMIAPSYAMDNFTVLFTSFDDLLGMMEIVYPEHIRIARRAQKSFFTLEDYHAWLRGSIAAIFAQLKDIPRYSPTILMALSYINRNYMRDLSLTQLSEYVYANASVLSSQFNDEVGMSLSEYVTGLRIKKAQELLRDTDMTVPAIAEQVGFTGAKYFREIFKKTTGLSPQGYRDWRSE